MKNSSSSMSPYQATPSPASVTNRTSVPRGLHMVHSDCSDVQVCSNSVDLDLLLPLLVSWMDGVAIGFSKAMTPFSQTPFFGDSGAEAEPPMTSCPCP